MRYLACVERYACVKKLLQNLGGTPTLLRQLSQVNLLTGVRARLMLISRPLYALPTLATSALACCGTESARPRPPKSTYVALHSMQPWLEFSLRRC